MAEGPNQATCPRCGCVSSSRHSSYVRTLKDLPAFGAAVSLKIRVARWRCRNRGCAVRFFTGDLPGIAEIRGRRTCRADGITQLMGHALGGRPGERIMSRIGLAVSDDTILRRLKRRARSATGLVQVVGVDEWAKRKGLVFGTIIVDLESRTVIDVLDKHSTDVVEKWLLAHPEIHTICRDRNGRYAKAARSGAPAAKQVADRFHLVQNLRETIERELSLHRAHLRVRLHGNATPEAGSLGPTMNPPARVPSNAHERRLLPARRLAIEMERARQIRQNKQNLFDEFKALQAAGLKISVISRLLGLNRRRFDKWAKQSALPERSKMQPRAGTVETFREHLRQRWQAGYRNGRMLFDEIQSLGYAGTYKSVSKLLSPWRLGNVALEVSTQLPTNPSNTATPDTVATSSPLPTIGTDTTQRQISPQIAAALLAKPRRELTARQAEIVDALKAGCPGYAVMRKLMMTFRSILRQPKSNHSSNVPALHRWMEQARAAGIASIQDFESQLQRDILAVEAAITERWSNGPVEGHVNRLKTLKRQMYGRAGVELLRARLIPLPADATLLQRE